MQPGATLMIRYARLPMPYSSDEGSQDGLKRTAMVNAATPTFALNSHLQPAGLHLYLRTNNWLVQLVALFGAR